MRLALKGTTKYSEGEGAPAEARATDDAERGGGAGSFGVGDDPGESAGEGESAVEVLAPASTLAPQRVQNTSLSARFAPQLSQSIVCLPINAKVAESGSEIKPDGPLTLQRGYYTP